MATVVNLSRQGLPSGAPSKRCGRNLGRQKSAPSPFAHLGGQRPTSRDANDSESLVLWRPVQQQQSQRNTLAAGGPRRGALLVAQSNLFDRVSRLSRAYISYYSDVIVSAAENPDIMLDQVLADMRNDLRNLRTTLGEVLAAKNLMQKCVDAAVTDMVKWKQRAEAAARAGAEDDALRAAIRRRRASQDTVDQLRVQLAQHEAAANTLQGAMSAMRNKLEQARLQAPALRARWAAAKAKQALQSADGLSSNGGRESAMAAFERAESKIIAAEMGNSIFVDVDITADDALEQRFAALDDGELAELRRKASA